MAYSTLYPIGYGSTVVSMARLREVHEPKMHPEFARRLFPWIESMGGLIGIGGGWRDTQPDKPGFAPDGKSFHQDQRFASGFVGYAAVDLVAVQPGRIHRAPTWGESVTAFQFKLHTFISGEPWHIQPIEIRGWQSWVDAGRPDPAGALPEPPPTITEGEEGMKPTCIVEDTKVKGVFALVGGRWVPWVFEIPDGVPYFKGDHQLTRAQILEDQGPEGKALWLARAK